MQSKRSRWRWVGWGAGAVFGLLALIVVFSLISSGARQTRHYEVKVRDVAPAQGSPALSEGERLYLSRGCGDCHGKHGEGRVVIDGPPGRIVAINLSQYVQSAR